MRKTVIENARVNVGSSPGFRTLEIVDPDDPTGGVILVPMMFPIYAQVARALMDDDPDPDELKHDNTDSRVVKIGG